MLLTNVLLIDNFIKRYQTSDFIFILMIAQQLFKQAIIYLIRFL